MRRSRHTRRALALAAAALVAVGAQAGSASARTEPPAAANEGAFPATMSSSERAALLKAAQDSATDTAKSLKLDAEEGLVPTDVVKDGDGTVHTRYNRTYSGLPVLGGDLIMHQAPSGSSVTRATDSSIAVSSTEPKISAAEAQQATSAQEAPRLVVWAATGQPALAWESVISGQQDDGTPSELHVITDATTGAHLFQFEGVETGTGTGQYSGQVPLTTTRAGSIYQLNDSARGGHKTNDLGQGTTGAGVLFTDADDVWGNGQPSNRQTAGVDAHYGAAVTWDYYRSAHARTGIRNDGRAAYSRVHYGNNYINAFWSDSCFCMTYGDGSGNVKPLTSIDVAAHEMTHGVTSATARLVYSGESGGLNESTSDIFAAAVEFNARNPSEPGNYLIGEKININGNGTPLRYMDRPSKDGRSPDFWYAGIGNIDVHYSSGVANHFFYLLSEGSGPKDINGVHYDSPTQDGQTVPGIGRANAAKVWYRALTTYMTSNTTYSGARAATLKAAADLFGQGSANYNIVASTWTAVNVDS